MYLAMYNINRINTIDDNNKWTYDNLQYDNVCLEAKIWEVQQEKVEQKGEDLEKALVLINSLNESDKAGIKNLIYENTFKFTDKLKLHENEIDRCILEVAKIYIETNKDPYDIVRLMPLKRVITMEDIDFIKENHKDNPEFICNINLSNQILPDYDWSNSREVFDYLNFDDKTFSKTSQDHFPEWYNPNEVFEKGKSIGLWIDFVHRMWYTWKGIGVAICDWKLEPHDDIETKEYVVEEYASKMKDRFHSSAVSSILAWKQTGVAPDSDLYFFAEYENFNDRLWWNDLKSALNMIFEKNKSLSDDKKIRVVSISGPLYWWRETEEIIDKLERSWVRVLYSGEFWKDFWYLWKKDPMWDPDDFENYKHYLGKKDSLFVNSWDRTVADPNSSTAYRHDTQPCASWAIPVVAWYYVLACQADPTMTPDKFKKLARDTSKILKTTVWKYWWENVWMPIEIKVIDIKALIEKIESKVWRN